VIYFNPYNAVDIKDSAEYWEVTALPEGCNTPDGYIRVRFEEDGSVSHYDPGLLTPRFVELPEGTPVDVSGYPVNSQDSQGFWEIVESNPDDQVYVVNRVRATNDLEEMSVDFKKVRQRVRVFSKVDHPEYYTKSSGQPNSKHPDYLHSAPYRLHMFAKKRREAQIASGSMPPKKRDDEEGYLDHPHTKYMKQWHEDNKDRMREWRENYEPYCCFCGRACKVSACICGGKGTGKKQLAQVVRRSLNLAITDALGGDLTDENCRLLTGFPAGEVQQILQASIPDDVNIEELLEKKCMQRQFRHPVCVIHKDHIKAVRPGVHHCGYAIDATRRCTPRVYSTRHSRSTFHRSLSGSASCARSLAGTATRRRTTLCGLSTASRTCSI